MVFDAPPPTRSLEWDDERRFVEAVLSFELFDQCRVEAKGAAIMALLAACRLYLSASAAYPFGRGDLVTLEL